MLDYMHIFYIFFKIGLFAFGGGYVILPMIYQDIQSFGLMEASEFSNIVALSQMTPGPIAINGATYVGFKSLGFLGAVSATIGVSLPAIIIIMIITLFINKFKESPIVQAVLSGIRPATVGMIASAVLFFANTSIFKEGFFSLSMFKNPIEFISIPSIIIFILTIICTVKFKMGPITLTVLGGILGVFIL